ncbi:acyltransferase [Terriglobus sp. TAA 43]|uniref:acyltransferase family protein n=1 Tax=Terriglobus sp. TAA 43 TaxID=278961 RepID=UPI00068CEBDC|nr:acyltransferase [Terriglobus sp. TAA 43]
MTSNASISRLHGLDTLRAFAVLVVVLYHLTIFGELPQALLPVTYYGFMGVDLFFVLSGFLIGRQLLKPYPRGKRPSIREFYLRRAYRILPAYFVVVALYFLVPAWRDYPQLPSLWKFLTFTMNFGFTFSTRAFSHAWSLCVEEHFYLVLPWLVLLMMRKPSVSKTISLIAFVVAGGIALRWWLVHQYPDAVYERVYYPTYTRLDGLVVGVCLALVNAFRPEWWRAWMRRGHLLFLAGIACVSAVIWMFRGQDLGSDSGPAKWGVIIGFPLLSLGLGMVTASAMSEKGWLARVRVPGAEMLATLAFALYLTHKPVAHFVMLHVPSIAEPHGPASWLMYAVVCLGAAVALHVVVERPAIWLRDRSLREKPKELDAEMRVDPAL